jgi:dihydrofolate reductase
VGVTVFHAQLAVSLDMRIARADGSVDWLDGFPPEELGFDGFLAGVGAILMGRGTYDAVRGFGEWPYGTRQTLVLTGRPLDDAPPGVVARGGTVADALASLEAERHARVWVAGGGRVIAAVAAAGRLDVPDLVVVPIVLGDGVPLFPHGTPGFGLRLEAAEPKPSGAVRLLYARSISSIL